jgi:putative NIF3 family GTP cyclohydrolase 1 type 2
MNSTKFLVSKEEGTFGMGMVGELNKELSEIEFFNSLKSKMNIKNIKHSPFIGKKIKKVAV